MNSPSPSKATARAPAKRAAKGSKLAEAASTAGLWLLALAGGAALIMRHALDACNWVAHPDVGRAFTVAECYDLLGAAARAAPAAKRAAAADLLFQFVLSTRREGALWLGLGLGSFYALSIPFDQRHSALFVLAASGSLACAVDAGHAGFLRVGAADMLTEKGKRGAQILCAFWLAALPGLWAGCWASRAKAKAKDELMGRTHSFLRKAKSGGNLKVN